MTAIKPGDVLSLDAGWKCEVLKADESETVLFYSPLEATGNQIKLKNRRVFVGSFQDGGQTMYYLRFRMLDACQPSTPWRDRVHVTEFQLTPEAFEATYDLMGQFILDTPSRDRL